MKGQAVVVSNNTGFSTGPHSHWGYFRKPRDRTNGYLGYVDPTPYFDGSGIIPPSGELMLSDQTKIPKQLLGEDQDLEIQQIRGLLQDGKRDNVDLANTRKENEELKQRLQSLSSAPIPSDQYTLKQILQLLLNKLFK